MRKYSILDLYWAKKHGQLLEMLPIEEDEESFDDEIEEVPEELLEDAQDMLEGFVDDHDEVEEASLDLALGGWSGKDVMPEDMNDNGGVYEMEVEDDKGNKHKLSSLMWDQPKEEDWNKHE